MYYLLDQIHKEVNNKSCQQPFAESNLGMMENDTYLSPLKKSVPLEETVTGGVGLVLT